MFNFRAFWLRLGYVLGFREAPPMFEPRPATAAVTPTEAPPKSDPKAEPTVDADWAGRRLLTNIILAGFVAVVVYGLFANASRVLIPLIWALGTLALGTLTGFLFCLPRIRQGEHDKGNADEADPNGANEKPRRLPTRGDNGYGLDINTNLEQISDWLSKIIVGLGLVELRQIPGHMVGLADYIAKDMGDPSARAFACGLVLFFSVCGFLYGYLYMRLILSHRFREADQKSKGLDQKLLEETARKIEDIDMYKINNAEMAGIQAERPDATAAEVEDAIRLLEAARILRPDRRKTNMLLGVLYATKKQDYERGIGICNEAIEAKRRSNTLSEKDEADFLYNIACFRIIEANALPPDSPRKAERQTQSLFHLGRAIQISPALKRLAGSPQQIEWNAVRETDEFKRLVAE